VIQMAVKKVKTNKVTIDLSTGTVELESYDEKLEKLVKIAKEIAKELTCNQNTKEWGIR